LLLTLSLIRTVAQNQSPDSLRNSSAQPEVIDQLNNNVDSIQASFFQKSDSMRNFYKRAFSKLDSFESELKIKLDNLMAPLDRLALENSIDSTKSRFENFADSVNLKKQILKIREAQERINIRRDCARARLNQNLQTLKDQTVDKLEEMNLPPQLRTKVANITDNINRFKIPVSDLNISSPHLDLGSYLAKPENLNLPSVAQWDGNVEALENVKENLNRGADFTNKANDYTKDIQELAKGNLGDMKELSNGAETTAEKLSGLNEVKEQTQAFREYGDKLKKMQNPDSLKELALLEIKHVAVNHFAGKEQVLKEAMETMSKYKLKYSSINSIRDIAKTPPNEMRGKPVIERIIPGIGIQFQRKGDDVLIDLNPYAGYRFTGRITAGVGWNQRTAYNIDKTKFNSNARIFGPRVYFEYILWKGFSPRAELEVMNTSISPLTRTPSPDPGKREWVWGAFIGMKKEYRFIKNVKGTASVMMRLFNPGDKSPFADVVNVRFGFEFPMKSKNPKATRP